MPHALVTGATGLVGSHITERLLEDRWNVRALVRPTESPRPLIGPDVDLREGNVLDAASVQRASAGVDVIFHAAASIVVTGGWEAFRSTNIDGTRNVIEAARATTARLVHISSVAVYGPGARYRPDRRPTDEDTPFGAIPARGYYARSKRESEALILDAHRRGTIWATVIRPDVIYGRRDRQFVPRIARILRLGFAPAVAGGGTTMAIVHAANVADAAVRAASSGIAGGRAYNAANDFDVTVAEFFRFAAIGLGRPIRLIPVRPWVLGLASRAATSVRRMLGSATEAVSGDALADFLSRDNPFSSARAREELGWDPPVRPGTGVADAFRWWRETQ